MYWKFSAWDCLSDDFSSRHFNIEPFYSYSARGKQEQILGYEIVEYWEVDVWKDEDEVTLFGQTIKREAGYHKEWCRATMLEFTGSEDAKLFLNLLAIALNYPRTYTLVYSDEQRIEPESEHLRNLVITISQYVTDFLVHAPLAKIAERKDYEKQLFRRIKEEQEFRASTKNAKVYALYYDNNCVKIGFSKKVYQRMSDLEPPPLKILKFAYTIPGFTEKEARRIESECHTFFKDRRKMYEYFNITFEEACEKLRTYSELFIAENP